jgi:hypothetical protein
MTTPSSKGLTLFGYERKHCDLRCEPRGGHAFAFRGTLFRRLRISRSSLETSKAAEGRLSYKEILGGHFERDASLVRRSPRRCAL